MKKMNLRRMISLLMIALLSVVICSCSKDKAEEQQEYIGIISAMDNEVELLLSQAEIDHVDTYGGVDYHVGTLCGKPVVIARSGIGKVMSASGVTAMLNHYQISGLIFTGIAGAVGDETEVLDIVVADRVVQHDYGTVTNDGFVWTYGNTGEVVGDKGYFYCDKDLVDKAYDAAVEVMGEDHVFKGTIVSGDQFIASAAYVERLRKDFDAKACEMEGAAIGAVCDNYEVPYVVIRAMSDKADGYAHESFDNMGDIAADNSSRIVIRMLESE